MFLLMPDQPLDETIRENAKGPAEARGDSGSVKQHSLQNQIEADRFLASKQAVKSKQRGIRFTKLSPPGAS